MVSRLPTSLLRERLASNPAVALVGPHQVGKTTLAQSLSGRYYDLDQNGDRRPARRGAGSTGSDRWAIEVKLTSSPSPEDVRLLARNAELVNATHSALVSTVARTAEGGGVVSCSLPEPLRRLTEV